MVWPQEGHFNNWAWEEATKQGDDRMGVEVNGFRVFYLFEHGFNPLDSGHS